MGKSMNTQVVESHEAPIEGSNYKPTKAVEAEETLCCGYKRCPTVKVYEDGSVTLDEDDGSHIELQPHQADRLQEMLAARKKG